MIQQRNGSGTQFMGIEVVIYHSRVKLTQRMYTFNQLSVTGMLASKPIYKPMDPNPKLTIPMLLGTCIVFGTLYEIGIKKHE